MRSISAAAIVVTATVPASSFTSVSLPKSFAYRVTVERPLLEPLGVLPAKFNLLENLPHHADALRDAFASSFLVLAENVPYKDGADEITATVPDFDAMTPDSLDATAQAASSQDNGWFGFLTVPIESLLNVLHSVFVAVGINQNAWGASILAMVVIIKIVTYPLAQSQIVSTTKMQALQPTMKDIQAKYQGDPETMNQKIAQMYQENDVNPLAGCIPSLVQIPVFIGLYRAVLTLAKENSLNEPFLWLPNLEGPVYGADPTHASDWLLKGWTEAGPSLGWDDTLAFLSIPLILITSQFVSMNLMQPKNVDTSQQNTLLLRILPFMVGWFSINVPAALGVYWIANNLITTLLTLQIRSAVPTADVKVPGRGPSEAAEAMAPPPSSFATRSNLRDRPAGFGGPASVDGGEVRPLTQPIDAEIVDEGDDTEDGDVGILEEGGEEQVAEVPTKSLGMEAKPSPTKKRGKKKKKRKN